MPHSFCVQLCAPKIDVQRVCKTTRFQCGLKTTLNELGGTENERGKAGGSTSRTSAAENPHRRGILGTCLKEAYAFVPLQFTCFAFKLGRELRINSIMIYLHKDTHSWVQHHGVFQGLPQLKQLFSALKLEIGFIRGVGKETVQKQLFRGAPRGRGKLPPGGFTPPPPPPIPKKLLQKNGVIFQRYIK